VNFPTVEFENLRPAVDVVDANLQGDLSTIIGKHQGKLVLLLYGKHSVGTGGISEIIGQLVSRSPPASG